MSLSSQVAPETQATDEITMFMGGIDRPEYEARNVLKKARDYAMVKLSDADNPDSRQLLWMIADYAVTYVYAPTANLETLLKAGELCRKLALAADLTEQL